MFDFYYFFGNWWHISCKHLHRVFFFFFFFFINLFISNKPINLGLCGSTGLLRLYTPICLYSQKRKLPWVYLKSSLHPTPPSGRAGSLSLQKKLSWLCHNPSLKKLIDAELITPRRHFFSHWTPLGSLIYHAKYT